MRRIPAVAFGGNECVRPQPQLSLDVSPLPPLRRASVNLDRERRVSALCLTPVKNNRDIRVWRELLHEETSHIGRIAGHDEEVMLTGQVTTHSST